MDFISNYSVQNSDVSLGAGVCSEDEKSYLHRPCFNVNIRLYKSSRRYRQIVQKSIRYMKSLFNKKYEDYPEIKGVSGANLAIPFNIIVVKDGKKLIPMINPVTTHTSQFNEMSIVRSNCGSLQLNEPITVKRFDKIRVRYINILGNYIYEFFDKPLSFTIQHEIDHNNGITIEDKHKEIEIADTILY